MEMKEEFSITKAKCRIEKLDQNRYTYKSLHLELFSQSSTLLHWKCYAWLPQSNCYAQSHTQKKTSCHTLMLKHCATHTFVLFI